MAEKQSSFRIWWQPPRKATDRLDHRQVTFLELFYDLVYVAIIAELSHTLASRIDWGGLARFAFLFVIVWWAWLNGSTYHDVHGNNDIRTRVFTFLQMFSVIAMAAFAHDALGETSAGFALAYAAFQLILTFLWWRTGVYDPAHRPLSSRYSAIFLLSTLLFGASAFVQPPIQFYLWGIAVLLTLFLPIYIYLLARRTPGLEKQYEVLLSLSPSLVERFGLFSIIVLGEVMVGVVSGLASYHSIEPAVWATAALGAGIGVGLWWVFFDSISHHPPHPNPGSVLAWFFLQLPIAMAITAAGASILNVIEHGIDPLPVGVRWLQVGSVAVMLLCTGLMTRIVQVRPDARDAYRVGRRVMFLAALLIAGLGMTALETIPLLVVMVGLLLAPVFFALKVWVHVQKESAQYP